MKKLRHGLISILNSSRQDSPEFRMASYLIKKIQNYEKPTLSDIAENCYVSKATVSRFCRRLGFSDYFSMVQTLQISRVERYRRYSEYRELSYEQMISEYSLEINYLINQVKDYATEEVLEHFTKILMKYNNIGIFGQMHAYPIALNFQMELSTFEKQSVCINMLTEQEKFILNNGKETLVIIISTSGHYFQDFEQYFDYQSKNNPYLVLLTNDTRLQVCSPYDEVFIIPSENNSISRPFSIQLFLNLVIMYLSKKIHTE